MTSYHDEIHAMMTAENAGLPEGLKFSNVPHFVGCDTRAAFVVAKAAMAELRARVRAAQAALQAVHGGDAELVNQRMREWRDAAADLRHLEHEHPPEGSIRQHAVRYLRDPNDQTLRNVALFVA